MDKIEQQRAHFESISEHYFEQRQTDNHLLLKDLMWTHFFKDKQDLKKGEVKVLEPMCGYAEGKKILDRYLGTGGEYTGFDYSDNLIEKVKAKEPELHVFVQDITKFNPAEKYDLIILIGGLHHVFQYTQDVIGIMNRSLNPGGYFINFEPTENNAFYRALRKRIYKKNDLFDEETEQGFSLKDLNGYFEKKGFTIADQLYPGLLSYMMYYNPDAFPALNIGGSKMVKFTFGLDKLFFRNWIGRKFSWATLTLWQKTSEIEIDKKHANTHEKVA